MSKDDTVILDGAGDKKAIEERCEQVGFLSLLDMFKTFFHANLKPDQRILL